MIGDFRKKNSITSAEAFGLLGLSLNADKEEIRRAYIEKMRLYHPDLGGDAYLASRINWARDVLLNRIG